MRETTVEASLVAGEEEAGDVVSFPDLERYVAEAMTAYEVSDALEEGSSDGSSKRKTR